MNTTQTEANPAPAPITNIQALNNLYLASRMAPISADQHDLVKKCAEQLLVLVQAADAPEAKAE